MILLPLRFRARSQAVSVCLLDRFDVPDESVARRYLTAAAVPIAVGLFALTDWILYYSVEIKQYSSDAALALDRTPAGGSSTMLKSRGIDAEVA